MISCEYAYMSEDQAGGYPTETAASPAPTHPPRLFRNNSVSESLCESSSSEQEKKSPRGSWTPTLRIKHNSTSDISRSADHSSTSPSKAAQLLARFKRNSANSNSALDLNRSCDACGSQGGLSNGDIHKDSTQKRPLRARLFRHISWSNDENIKHCDNRGSPPSDNGGSPLSARSSLSVFDNKHSPDDHPDEGVREAGGNSKSLPTCTNCYNTDTSSPSRCVCKPPLIKIRTKSQNCDPNTTPSKVKLRNSSSSLSSPNPSPNKLSPVKDILRRFSLKYRRKHESEKEETLEKPRPHSFVNSQEWTLARAVPDLKLGILGTTNSGKSALVHRYLTGSYMQDESPEGGRFKKEVILDTQSYLLLIRDEGGAPEMQFTNWVDAVVCVFSVENEMSFNAIYTYYTKMAHYRNLNEIPVILVGTQDGISESNPRIIDDARARKLATDLKRCSYYETCATYGLNVERVFQDACQKIVQLRMNPVTPTNSRPSTPNHSNMRGYYTNTPTSKGYDTHSSSGQSTSGSGTAAVSVATIQTIQGHSPPFREQPTPPQVPQVPHSTPQIPHLPTTLPHSTATAGRPDEKKKDKKRDKERERQIEREREQATMAAMIQSQLQGQGPYLYQEGPMIGHKHSHGTPVPVPIPIPPPTTAPPPPPTSIPPGMPLDQMKVAGTPDMYQLQLQSQQQQQQSQHSQQKKGEEEKKKNGETVGSGRVIPIKQGYLYKKSAKPLSKDWKKKYVTLKDDGRLAYHPSLHDYMDDVHAKEISLMHTTVKIPGQRPRGSRTQSDSQPQQNGNLPGKVKDKDAAVVLTGYDQIRDTSSAGSGGGQKTDDSVVISNSSLQADPESGSRIETPNVKKRHRRAKSGAKNLDTSQDGADSDGYEFMIVSIENKQWHFEACSIDEREDWVTAIEQQILFSLQGIESNKSKSRSNTLTDPSAGQAIRSAPGNQQCADCDAANPGWASLNLGALICIECSGIHRNLGTHVSRVRSLDLDEWPPELAEVMKNIGNQLANSIWEPNTKGRPKPIPSSSRDDKELWIRAKYEQKEFLPPPPHQGVPLPQQLIDAVARQHIHDTALVLAHCEQDEVNAPYSITDTRTALHIAAALGNVVLVQLLLWYGSNVKAVDHEGRNALFYARSSSSSECVELLRVQGCPENPTLPRRRGSNNQPQQHQNSDTFEKLPASVI